VRAGVARFAESPYMGPMSEPFTMGFLGPELLPPADPLVANFPGIAGLPNRMLRLAGLALAEAVQLPAVKKPIPVFLGLPERPEPSRDFLNLLIAQSEIEIDLAASRLYPKGRAAGIFALKEAIDTLCAGKHEFVIVGGVDSYWDNGLLQTLEIEGRLKTGINPDGYIPGEGAAFLLLARPEFANAQKLATLGIIGNTGFGFEKGHRYSQEPYRGDGLAETLADVFSRYDSKDRIRTIYTGLNGESYCGKEWGVAFIRNSNQFSDDAATEHPADCLGDTGAAMAPIMAALSVIAQQARYKNGPCLIWCTSDHGHCAACVVHSQAGPVPPSQPHANPR
ncbi:MAG TPA: hypothetical protein VNV43_12510, partial [Candidatus Acidoferrales bacterium]|nr:hypothetical protein [Candidatus Acidoferrales bacterium]